MTHSSKAVRQIGQSLWYDNIQRRLLEDGSMAAMVEEGIICGVTSNPSIFNNAIGKSHDYDEALIPLAKAGKTAFEIYESLAIADIQAAADLFKGLYESSEGGDGYVSLEVNPNLAHDTEATYEDALRLWELVDRPNLMIKIPATKEGIPAVESAIYSGLNVNITLIFSQARYSEVMEAYISGLENRLAEGLPLNGIASVASFFISRIDSKVDRYLDEVVDAAEEHAALAASLKGKVAVANAKLAYTLFKEVFGSERFAALKEASALLQRPLWASTSTKNPAYSDVKYVEELIGPDTVNTVPPKTLLAFEDHGKAESTIEADLDAARQILADLERVGISLEQATQELEDEGVAAFSQAFADLLETVELRRKDVLG
ncbi:MAG: transaldolase [Chloroflexi bacterium]|nr:transaldolase [Chloroflexota bacterium]